MANKKGAEKTIEWGGTLEHFPKHAQLIAQLITEWNVVEFHFVNLLSAMTAARKPIISPMVFAIANNRGRLDVMEAALVRLANDKETKALIVQHIAEARAVLNARNTYTHALYVTQHSSRKPQLQMQVFKDYHAGKEQSRRTVSLAELQKVVERTEDLTGNLFNLFVGIVGMLPLPASHESGFPSPPESNQVFRRKLRAPPKPPESSGE